MRTHFADASGVSIVHRLNLSGIAARPTPTAFDKPVRSAGRNGWTVDVARYGTTTTHVRITDPNGAAVVLTTSTPRIPGLAGALLGMPVNHLEVLFDLDDPQRHAAWAAIPRLHTLALGLTQASEPAELRRDLSWANLTLAESLAWKSAGVRSGLDAIFYATQGLTPERVSPYTAISPRPSSGWYRADLALYARRNLPVQDALAWAGLHLSHANTTAFLDAQYTHQQVKALMAALRREHLTAYDTRALGDWARAGVPGAIAATAVKAGLRADEAGHLTVQDGGMLATMAALRT